MSSSETSRIPAPLATDSEQVRGALETAASLWVTDSRESLRWLRTAAESAADSGDDLRSVQLARRAADLRSEANISPSMPPSAVPLVPHGSPAGNPAQTVPATPAAAAAAALQTASEVARGVQQVSGATNGASSQNGAPASGAASSEQEPLGSAPATQPTGQGSPDEASTPVEPTPVAPTAHVEQGQVRSGAVVSQVLDVGSSSSVEGAARSPVPAEIVSTAQSASFATAGAASGLAPVEAVSTKQTDLPHDGEITPVEGSRARSSAPPAADSQPRRDSSPPTSARFATHRTVLVALSERPDAQGQFAVHPLAEGESAEPGFKRALLVALEPGKRLFPGRD